MSRPRTDATVVRSEKRRGCAAPAESIRSSCPMMSASGSRPRDVVERIAADRNGSRRGSAPLHATLERNPATTLYLWGLAIRGRLPCRTRPKIATEIPGAVVGRRCQSGPTTDGRWLSEETAVGAQEKIGWYSPSFSSAAGPASRTPDPQGAAQRRSPTSDIDIEIERR